MEQDIEFEIGTKEQKFWTDAKAKAVEDILENKRMIEINELILIHAEKRIKEEKNLNKSEK